MDKSISEAARDRRVSVKTDRILEERRQGREAEFDEWLEAFDANRNGRLERDEVRRLLERVEPERVVSEKSLDYMWARMRELKPEDQQQRGVGSGPRRKNSITVEPRRSPETAEKGIEKWQLRYVLPHFLEFCAQSAFIDGIIDRFDANKSGSLDQNPAEIRALLVAIVDGSCALKGTSAQVTKFSASLYKAKALRKALDDGLITKSVFRSKCAKAGCAPEQHHPLGDALDQKRDRITDADVLFVVQHSDKNNNGKIDRDEIICAIEAWTYLLVHQAQAAAPIKSSGQRLARIVSRTTPSFVSPDSRACNIM